MLEEQAVVVAKEGEYVWVQAQRKSGCAKCNANTSCGTGLLSKFFSRKEFRVKVLDTQHAELGDHVVIGVSEKAMLVASFYMYLMPLLLMFVFALVAQASLGLNEPLTILFALFGLAGGFLFFKKHFGLRQNSKQFQFVLLKKLPNYSL